MIKQKKVLLALVVSSLLVACGSSSSQGSSDPIKDTPTKKTPTKKTPTKKTPTKKTPTKKTPTKKTPPKPTGPVTGVISLTDGTNKMVAGSDLNSIKISGKTIPLAFPNISGGTFVQLNGFIASGSNYKVSKFGVNNTKAFTTFSQGYATKNMPTKGTAKYVGGAAGVYSEGKSLYSTTGSSAFDVDFAKKTVKGKLTNWGSNDAKTKPMADIAIDAKIKGNAFSSKNTQGQFYGNKASEMGSITSMNKNGKKFIASFGAIKK